MPSGNTPCSCGHPDRSGWTHGRVCVNEQPAVTAPPPWTFYCPKCSAEITKCKCLAPLGNAPADERGAWGEPPYECCDLTFSTWEDFCQHVNERHPAKETFR